MRGPEYLRPTVHRVVTYLGVSHSQLFSPLRTDEVSKARDVLVYLLKNNLGWSWARIGRYLRRHHTTCISAYRRAERRLDRKDQEFQVALALGEQELKRKTDGRS